MRESSPPEATLASGRGVVPAWPATRNSADSTPNDCGASVATSSTSKRPPAMPSCCIVRVTAAANLGAAARRAAETRRASASYAVRAESAARSSASRSAAASSSLSSACHCAAAPAGRPADGDGAAPASPTPRGAPRARAAGPDRARRDRGSRPACAPRPAAAPARPAAPRSGRRDARRIRRRPGARRWRGRRASRRSRRPPTIASSASRAASSSDWPWARRVCSASSSAHSSAPGASLATSPICQASRSRSRSRSPCFSRAQRERLGRRTPRRPERRQRRGVDLRVRVEQGAHRGRARQPLPGVLAVDVDEQVGRLAQLRDRRAAAVDPRPALALRVDRAAQQHAAGVAGIGVEAGVGEPWRERRRHVELGADLGTRRAFAHDAGVAAAAERELERVDEDRLAGAGLAAQHRQARRELDLERVDDDEVADRETMQHRLTTPDAQCSLPRRVA